MNIFDIIGPIMIGPSSSHTAGAVRIARVARILLDEAVKKAIIKFHGSFATTYKGHGTDKAIIGGLMGFSTDDVRIRESIEIAAKEGIEYSIETCELDDVHPNTVIIELEGVSGRKVSIMGWSIGGGNISIKKVNGLDVDFSGQFCTLVIEHLDKPGTIASVTGILGNNSINIALMKVFRSQKGSNAIMVIETDQTVGKNAIIEINGLESVINAVSISNIK
jgi:L-serine dehydratase